MSNNKDGILETGKLPEGTLNVEPKDVFDIELTDEEQALARVRLREAAQKE